MSDSRDLATQLEQELETYAKHTCQEVVHIVSETTKEAIEKLKLTSPKKSGRYARSWNKKTTHESATGLVETIYNKRASLTHLLENGHAKRGGGRVSGIRHIAPVEKEVLEGLERKLRERL